MIAYCGLNCSKCDAYLATQNNSDAQRSKTAEIWSKRYGAKIEAAQINCNACKSDGIRFFHCDACEIRQCGISKGLENCAMCEEYICDTLSKFINLAPEAGTALEKLRL